MAGYLNMDGRRMEKIVCLLVTRKKTLKLKTSQKKSHLKVCMNSYIGNTNIKYHRKIIFKSMNSSIIM